VQGEIIEFWRAVEMFSPQPIPRVRPQERVFEIAEGDLLPWDPGHPQLRERLTKDQTWRHTVFLGTYPLETVFSALKDVFPPDPENYEERPSGESALLGLVVAADGTLLTVRRCCRPAPGRRGGRSIRARAPAAGSTGSAPWKATSPSSLTSTFCSPTRAAGLRSFSTGTR
jgi:hypothetical protein